jgi:predicted MPP superfamily phosphohydrolase
MKRILVILLIVTMVCIMVLPLSACSSATDYDFAFITDMHIVANSLMTSENYSDYSDADKIINMTEAISNSLVDELIEKKYKYVLVGGDLTESGDETSHLVCAAMFAKLEDAGVNVFVVNGNHDIASNKGKIGTCISSARFKEIYYNYGYDEAIATCPKSLSYVADLDDDYRLIAIDTMTYYDDDIANCKEEAMSNSHYEWIKAQVELCKEDDVTPIIITHESLLNHYPDITDIIMDVDTSAQYSKLVEYLADNGANYVFAGHYHIQDILSETTTSGNTLYETETSSLAFYPCNYMEMSFTSKKITINAVPFDNINTDYLASATTESELEAISNGLQEYCKQEFDSYVYNIVSNLGKEGGFIDSLDLEGDSKTIMDIFATEALDKVINNPLYIKDEDNNTSLESILLNYNIAMPETTYTTLADMAVALAEKLFEGDENLTDAPELFIAKYAVFSLFYYINETSDLYASAYPTYPVLNIDVDKIFNEGILECYNSNVIAFTLEVLEGVNLTAYSICKGLISENFDELGGTLVTSLISGLTLNKVESIGEYFDSTNILLDKLIEEGIYDIYAKDYIQDREPADNYLEIILDD